MRTKYVYTLRATITALAFTTLACSLFVNVAPTAVPTQEPLQFPTGIPVVVASPTNPPPPIIQNTAIPLTQAAGSHANRCKQPGHGRRKGLFPKRLSAI